MPMILLKIFLHKSCFSKYFFQNFQNLVEEWELVDSSGFAHPSSPFSILLA